MPKLILKTIDTEEQVFLKETVLTIRRGVNAGKKCILLNTVKHKTEQRTLYKVRIEGGVGIRTYNASTIGVKVSMP